MTNPMDMAGRTILVTGASSGLGRETAVLLSELGAKVIAHGRDLGRLDITRQRLQGEGHLIETMDLTQIDALAEWVQRLAISAGPIHGLVHCAGVSLPQPLRTWTLPVHEKQMRINLTAGLALAKAVRHPKVRAEDVSIVFLSSIAGMKGSLGQADYSASKGALVAVARTLALELAKERVRVNCVAPGLIQDVGMSVQDPYLAEDQKSSYFTRHPLGPGRGLDVANAVAFLLSSASRWITGTCLVVDGGMTA